MSLPASIARLLTDSLHQDHPDVQWSPPANLPPADKLREAVRILEAQLVPCPAKQAGFCLAKLAVAYEVNSKMDEDTAVLRTEVWLEACHDIPQDLWEAATIEALKTLKWHPKPAEFRSLIAAQLSHRERMLDRARKLLDLKPQIEQQAYVERPQHVRSRELAGSFRRVGNLVKAEYYERLAEKEQAQEAAA